MENHKVGDIFKHKGVTLKVCEGNGEITNDCFNCHFAKTECTTSKRYKGCKKIDNIDIWFKEIKENKEMNKQYFENEEEFERFILEIAISNVDIKTEEYGEQIINLATSAEYAKQRGYIKQSPLEKAREIYQHLEKTQSNSGTPIHPDIVDYVNLLEEALKKREGKS